MNRRLPCLPAPRCTRRPSLRLALALSVGVAGCFSPDDRDWKEDTAEEADADVDADMDTDTDVDTGTNPDVDEDGDGWTVGDGDCDDTDATVYPGAHEYCNGKDNDCNGVVDDDYALDASTWYRDADGDGYGDPDSATTACSVPDGYLADNTDCDDADVATYPGAAPNDSATACMTDADGDGYGSDDPASGVTAGTDCNDTDSSVNPGAAEAGADEDCDGVIDLSFAHTKLTGEAGGDYAGRSVSGAGDVNGDGFDDILVGAYGEDSGGSSAGAAYLVYGPVSGTLDLSAADAKLIGEASGDYAGMSVSGAGDVNGDGLADLLVGAYPEDSGGTNAGAAYLVYGPVSGTLSLARADAKFIGEAEGDRAGCSVFGAGDVNGDGFDDILVGAYAEDSGGTNAGAVYLVHGPVSGTLSLASADAKLIGESGGDYAGISVSGAGDVNGDGFDDLIVGAPYEDSGGSMAGAAYLVYGPVSGSLDLGAADAKLTGETAGDYAGFSVSGAGDVNGDGFDDILVGAYGEDSGGTSAGAAYLVYGPVSGTLSLGHADAKLTGEAEGDAAGYSVSGAGDVNGDGFDDLLLGAASEDSGGSLAGAAYLALGPVSGTHSLADAEAKFIGEASYDRAGCSVSGAGNVNSDGYDDLIVGAFGESTGGAAYLVLGWSR